MKAINRWWWITRRELFDNEDGHHVLDILRYDGAQVHSNAPDGFYLFSSSGDYSGPRLDRLRSYHVEPSWVSHRAMPIDTARFEIEQWIMTYHAKQAQVRAEFDRVQATGLKPVDVKR